MSVAPQDDLGLPQRYGELRLMQAGHHRRTSDVSCGSEPGGRLTVFTLAWETGMGTDRQVVRRTAVVLESARSLPGLYFSRQAPLEPVGAFRSYSRVAIAAGASTETDEAWLQAETPWKPAVGESLQRWLLDQPAEWTFECRGRLIAGYAPVARGTEQEPQLVDAVRTLAEQLGQAEIDTNVYDASRGNIP